MEGPGLLFLPGQAPIVAARRAGKVLGLRHCHGNRPSGQSSTTIRIAAITAKVMATATMVCWLTT